MKLLQPTFAVVNEDATRFAYLDLGDIVFKDMPMKSGMADTLEGAEKLIVRMFNGIKREIARQEQMLRDIVVDHPNIHDDEILRCMEEDCLDQIQEGQLKLRTIKLRIVEINTRLVP